MSTYQKRFKTFKLNLVKDVTSSLSVDGDMYHVVSSEYDVKIILDQFTDIDNQAAGMGGSFKGDYKSVSIESKYNQELIIVLGYGIFNDSRGGSGGGGGGGTAEEFKISSLMDNDDDVIIGDSNQLLRGSSVNTREVLITVPVDAKNGIRIGDANVSSNSGFLCDVGTSHSISFKGDIFAIRDGEENVKVSVLKISK